MIYRKKNTLTLIAILFILFVLRVYKLRHIGFFDYDSAKNFSILQEIAKGDWLQLFHHSSPSFYLFLTPIYFLGKDYVIIEWVCSLFNVLAIYYAVKLFTKLWKLDNITHYALLLLVGSSTFLVVSSRYLAIESLSLFSFILSLYYLFKENKRYYIFCLLFAFTFSINYKTILFLPIFFIVDWLIIKHRNFLQRAILLWGSILLIILCYSLLSSILNLDFSLYAKHLFVQIFARNPNPEIRIPLFNFDVLFYFKYIFRFENIAIIIGLIILIATVFKRNNSTHQIALFFIIGSFFIGMNFLAKAPRGLLFIYPFIFALGYKEVLSLLKTKYLIYGVPILCFSYNLWLINQYIYPYAKTNYDKVEQQIKILKSKELQTSVGLGITAFTPQQLKITPVFHADSLKRKNPSFFLRDDYYKVANIGNFQKVEGKTVGKWKEPSLCSPYLYLESCEYNHRTYKEAIESWEKANQKEYHLELIQLN